MIAIKTITIPINLFENIASPFYYDVKTPVASKISAEKQHIKLFCNKK